MSRQVLTWPNAASLGQQYSNIAADLRTHRIAISAVANATVPTTGFTGTTMDGDYYDEYDTHVTLWVTEARGLHTDFSSFLTALDSRITQADSAAALWRSRIGVTHTVP